jgi:hypothetical protein
MLIVRCSLLPGMMEYSEIVEESGVRALGEIAQPVFSSPETDRKVRDVS